MKRAVAAALFLSFAGAIAAVPAFGDSVLNDGNVSATPNFGAIGFQDEISNWFTLTSGATINGVIFEVWVDPGASLESTGWSIGTTPYYSGAGGLPVVNTVSSNLLETGGGGTTM